MVGSEVCPPLAVIGGRINSATKLWPLSPRFHAAQTGVEEDLFGNQPFHKSFLIRRKYTCFRFPSPTFLMHSSGTMAFHPPGKDHHAKHATYRHNLYRSSHNGHRSPSSQCFGHHSHKGIDIRTPSSRDDQSYWTLLVNSFKDCLMIVQTSSGLLVKLYEEAMARPICYCRSLENETLGQFGHSNERL